MSTFRPFRQRGTVLLGVVVLAALVLIGAATIGVIYLRQLDQQRQVQTQTYLENAFLGLFPGLVGKRANLHKDFGYSPASAGAPYDLKVLVDRSAIGTSDSAHAAVGQFTGTLSQTTFNAWNGPYWNGPVDSTNRPADAWGRPLQLRYITTTTPPGWQVFSLGKNGQSETGDVGVPPSTSDDQVYPIPPYKIPVSASTPVLLTCSPLVQVNYTTNGAEQIRITITDGVGTVHASGQQTVNKTHAFSYAPAIYSGTVTIVVEKKPGGSWVEIYNVTSVITTCSTLTINLP